MKTLVFIFPHSQDIDLSFGLKALLKLLLPTLALTQV